MDSRPARNEITFKLYNLACSFHCKIQSYHEDKIYELHCSLYVTQFNDIRVNPLFTRVGGYKYDMGTQSYGGAYKIPHLLMRVVKKSVIGIL